MRIENLDDSPPSIRIQIPVGSGAFEPSGVLAVLPSSTIHLDCMYPRRRGTPEWTSTGRHRSYYTGKIYNSFQFADLLISTYYSLYVGYVCL